MLEKISLIVENGKVYCSSIQIAEYFTKEHRTVLRSIDSLIDIDNELALHDFVQSSYLDSQGKTQRCFLMTRDGFMFLAMGFTGEAAYKIKKKIIAEYNRMESELRELTKLSPAEFLVYQAQRILEHERALALHQKQIEATNVRIDAISDKVSELSGERGYMSILGYAKKINHSIDTNTASKLGKACSNLCRKRNHEIKKLNHEMYGIVGSYPLEVLKEVFDSYLSK